VFEFVYIINIFKIQKSQNEFQAHYNPINPTGSSLDKTRFKKFIVSEEIAWSPCCQQCQNQPDYSNNNFPRRWAATLWFCNIPFRVEQAIITAQKQRAV